MTWGSLLDRWSAYMTAAGTPDTTRRLRLYQVRRLARETRTEGPEGVDFEGLVEWLASHRGWAPNTRRSYRTSLRAFWTWSMATGQVTASPAHLLPTVRVPRARPHPTPEDAYAFAVRFSEPLTALAIRLAGQCGLRRSEVAQVRREDVVRDLDGWSLVVVGKGGHERAVPLPADLARLLRAKGPGWVFPSPRKAGAHVTPHHLAKLVSAELPDGMTMHSLRHRCGTVTYAATKDLRAVQELLGHAKMDTTVLYTMVPTSAIRAAVDAAA